jgi:hypothetical protein
VYTANTKDSAATHKGEEKVQYISLTAEMKWENVLWKI